jgi:hypothetical protein
MNAIIKLQENLYFFQKCDESLYNLDMSNKNIYNIKFNISFLGGYLRYVFHFQT